MFIIILDNSPEGLPLLFSSLCLQRVKNQYCSDTRKRGGGNRNKGWAMRERRVGKKTGCERKVHLWLIWHFIKAFLPSSLVIGWSVKQKGTSLKLLKTRATTGMTVDAELFLIPLRVTGPVAVPLKSPWYASLVPAKTFMAQRHVSLSVLL